jgi:hypothetical protein
MGSMLTAYGGVLATQGKTTGALPSDKKSRDLFYAANRKPWSVYIKGKWIPMWYFGPAALALAIPASFADRYRDGKEVLNDTEMQKLGRVAMDLAKVLGSQTSLTGMKNMFSALSGDIDHTMKGAFGFTATQFIPLAGFNRWVNKNLDQLYRKSDRFIDPMLSSIPGGTKFQEPFTNPLTGKPSGRDPLNAFIPYDIGRPDKEGKKAEKAFQMNRRESQKTYLQNKKKKLSPKLKKLPTLKGLPSLPGL